MSYWEEKHTGTKLAVAVNHKISALFVTHIFKLFLCLPSFLFRQLFMCWQIYIMICYSSGNCFEKTFYFDGIKDNFYKAHFHQELVYLNLCISY